MSTDVAVGAPAPAVPDGGVLRDRGRSTVADRFTLTAKAYAAMTEAEGGTPCRHCGKPAVWSVARQGRALVCVAEVRPDAFLYACGTCLVPLVEAVGALLDLVEGL